MQAVILAGGLGTRLRPLTHLMPKVMMPIGGRPFLAHMVRHLASQQVRDIILCTGHFSEQIEAYFQDGRSFGVQMHYSVETTPLGTGGAVQHASSLITANFLLVNGDTYLPIEIAQLVRAVKESAGCLGALAVYPQAETNNLCLDAADYVAAYAKGTPDAMTHTDAGVAYYARGVLPWVQRLQGAWSWEQDVYRRLIERRALRAVLAPMPFYDMGTPQRLHQAREQLIVR